MANHQNEPIPKDTSWIRSSFLTLPKTVTEADRMMRNGSGWLKFMDTTLGGNTAINAPYGFCPYADIDEMRLTPNVSQGMGRWYSKHIDDWGHNVHFQMGVPSYTSTLGYMMKAIDGSAARYAATGRVPGAMGTLGKFAGYLITAVFWEAAILMKFFSMLFAPQSSRFYYLKPTMYQYWRTVQTILNSLSANLGISPASQRGDMNNREDGGYSEGIKSDYPKDKWDKGGLQYPKTIQQTRIGGGDLAVDVHRVASRAQFYSNRHQEELAKLLESANLSNKPADLKKLVEQATVNAMQGSHGKHLKPTYTYPTLEAYHRAFSSNSWYVPEVDEHQSDMTLDIAKSLSAIGKKEATGQSKSGFTAWFQAAADSFTNFISKGGGEQLQQALVAELRDGSAWASFRIENATASINEGWDNSSTDTEFGGFFNNLSQALRTARHNLGDGKTGIGLIDWGLEAVGGKFMDFITDGATSQAVLPFVNPLIGLFYGAKISMPKRWAESTTRFSTTTFEFELRCGYGNIISYYQDILFPLAMCIAMVAPRGTGMHSYGAPFYVKYYSKGRNQVKIGMVSSLNITRGTGTAGWHRMGYPMNVKVSMTVENMDKDMFTPVSSGILVDALNGFKLFSNPMDDNAMGDYMAVLSALGLNEQEYYVPQLKKNLNKLIYGFDSFISPHNLIAMGASTPIGELAKMLSNQTDVRR